MACFVITIIWLKTEKGIEKNMPWKDHESWACAEILAPALSFIMAFIRVLYENNEPSWIRRLLESFICGLITLSCGFAVDAIGVSSDWKYVIGGAVGYFGTDYVKILAQRFFNEKIRGFK